MIPFLEDLKEANDFMNLLLDNINMAVLIADENLNIYRFNNSFLNLFDEPREKVSGKSIGRAMGCIHTINENKPCGETSHCENCLIRKSMIETMIKKTPVDKQKLEKYFYIDGRPQSKIMEMTTRYISYNHRKMVLVIFYDVTEIERQRIELQEKQTQLDRDLEAAAGIQQSLLPDRAPDIAGIQIAWTFEPSSQIGGDTFNIQQIDKHHIGLYIMDVCGHGVSAAFFAVTVSQFLQSRSCFLVNGRGVASPKTVLDNLNKDFPFERFDSYFSIVYIIIDLMQGRLVYSCAGHPPPVLIHAQGDMDLLNRRGPVIGLSRDTTYHEEITPLYPGDKLILYTDGVFENRNIHKEYLGRQKFYEILKRNASGNIQSLVDATYRRVEDFREKAAPEDDISILGLVYKDPNFS